MKRSWEKFNIHISTQGLEVISVQSLRQLRGYRNPYEFDLSSIGTKIDFNIVIVVDKKIGVILGYLKCQASATGEALVASENFDTFPVERLELSCLEIIDFQIAESAWDRLGFRSALGRGVLAIMNELACEAVIVHYREAVIEVDRALLQLSQSPFYSKFIFCEEKHSKANVLGEYHKLPVGPINKSAFPKQFTCLLGIGLEIWSAPIICSESNEISMLLGFISSNGLSQARPLSLVAGAQREDLHAFN